ncbi:thiopeptide-type bacteriocin biosynthesis protein [Chryseobacterium sp. sg2396]|uniref:thiopeptide-type bacteriocin biosynthesis protein n=1 Tax=Chryseobacterium sp. sg2396 TaxID=3276280 RepID=UPI0025F27944|nr:thiopeptide-type bacteriocin biosynthesis protein [uncultured Chryseobacterium sp.]
MTDHSIQRDFIIGDDWLYYKFFCGHNASNKIITEFLKPISEEFISSGMINEWFFIRYNDPSYHIRYRIKLSSPKYIGQVIIKLNNYLKKYLSNEIVWNVELDTYKRELERYGSNTMEISEKIFYIDSKIISDFIENSDSELLYQKSLFGLRLVAFYLDTFNLSVLDKLKYTELLKNSYYKEFGSEKEVKKQLDKVFVSNQNSINKILDTKISKANKLTKSIAIYKYEIKNNIKSLLSVYEKNSLEINIESLLSSYIHMSINRLFIHNNRLHELNIYDFLWRYYKKLYYKQNNM